MKFPHPRPAAASMIAALAVAAGLTAGPLAGGTAAAASASPAVPAAPAATSYVLVTCAGQDVARPSWFVLTCADDGWGYVHMHWHAWGSTAAYATATTYVNDCYPNCAEGTFYHFPAMVVVWRPEALPGHSGERYYTRLSWVFERKACLPSPPDGKITCLRQTGTYALVP